GHDGKAKSKVLAPWHGGELPRTRLSVVAREFVELRAEAHVVLAALDEYHLQLRGGGREVFECGDEFRFPSLHLESAHDALGGRRPALDHADPALQRLHLA